MEKVFCRIRILKKGKEKKEKRFQLLDDDCVSLVPTWKSEKRRKVSTVVDPGGVACARHPQVLVDGGGGDHAAVRGGFFPILILKRY